MNWEQAKKELDQNKEITLPDMEGYWSQATSVRESAYGLKARYTSVYWHIGTKVTEAPMHEPKYTERTDWIIHER
jgi:hypothetical protein